MKKLIVSALMALTCGVLFADDTDQYLYWMIGETPTFKDQSGATVSDVVLSDYNAQIKIAGTDQYLYLYEFDGDSNHEYFNAAYAQWDMLAGVGDLGNTTSFLVELFNESGVAYASDTVSYGELSSYISSMQGKATPAETYAFTTFRAVPEPTSGLLLLLGIAGLALKRKRA